jgi:glycosyltransferase involved in cell wall biosynthesis
MTMLIGCMMATNAAEVIELALGSLHSVVDELVLVDGGSTDRTKAIARDFGATVIESKWHDNYAAQRQVYLDYALQRATQNDEAWAFVLDSDEILVDGELRQTIAELSRQGLEHAMVPRKWLVDTAGGLRFISSHPHYPDRQLRLLKLRPGLHYTGRVHEVLHGVGPGRNVDAPTILHLDLLRTGLAQRKQKVKVYEQSEPGSGVPRFYMFERHGFTLEPLTIGGSLQPFMGGIRGMTSISLTEGDLRGRTLQYRLTRRPLDLIDWARLKARRLPGRIKRVGRGSLERIRTRLTRHK